MIMTRPGLSVGVAASRPRLISEYDSMGFLRTIYNSRYSKQAQTAEGLITAAISCGLLFHTGRPRSCAFEEKDDRFTATRIAFDGWVLTAKKAAPIEVVTEAESDIEIKAAVTGVRSPLQFLY